MPFWAAPYLIRKFPSVSLFQLFMFVTAIAAFVAFARPVDSSRYLDSAHNAIWTRNPLSYNPPTTPDIFIKDGPLYIDVNPPLRWRHTYESGSELYRASHIRGWDRCRYDFHRNFETWEPFAKDNHVDLDKSKNWATDASLEARLQGYSECQRQINVLLETRSANQLRNELTYSKYWHLVPAISIGTLAIFGMFISWLFANVENRSRSARNWFAWLTMILGTFLLSPNSGPGFGPDMWRLFHFDCYAIFCVAIGILCLFVSVEKPKSRWYIAVLVLLFLAVTVINLVAAY